MEARLRTAITERLLSEEGPGDDRVLTLVDAACEGDRALDEALGGAARPPPVSARSAAAGTATEPPGAYLESITVAGFRGVGPETTLSLPSGPGLTLVVGRNGSGKSSFAEGLETLLTGTSGRWKDRRTKLWREGWRNLHSQGASWVSARFSVEERGAVVVRRKWPAGAELEASELTVTSPAAGETTLDDLGWDSALEEFRPFLSYPELGALLDEPSKAYDALHRVLGLEELTEAKQRLTDRRKQVEGRAKNVRAAIPGLRSLLEPLTDADPRAGKALAALGTGKGRSKPDLDTLAALVTGDPEPDTAGDPLVVLRRLANLTIDPADALTRAAEALREADAAESDLRNETVDRHQQLVEVLERALPVIDAAGEGGADPDCPVCARPMSPGAVQDARDRLARSRSLTAQLAAAERQRQTVQEDVARLFGRLSVSAFREAVDAGVLDALPSVLAEPAPSPDAGVGALADRLDRMAATLPEAAASVRAAASARLAELDDRFRQSALELAAWLPAARQAATESDDLAALKSAEKWLAGAEGALRDARFRPIADQVLATWKELGEQSSVSLAGVRLGGQATRRRIDLDVTVDGAESAAVGVMSQGELNAMALSLFLPRMMLSESPFRFLVVDDPVQAMDPHRIDGLARALERAAKTRQVLVFTHDARLVDAVRRLQIPAQVLRVDRRAASTVEVVVHHHPVKAYLKDAFQLARAEPQLGRDLVRSVLPGFLRGAIEAACLETIRRRRLAAGDDHEALAARIERHGTTNELVAFALFDDPDRGAAVLEELNKQVGREVTDGYQAIRKHTHGSALYAGDLSSLIEQTKRLATLLEKRR